MPPTPPRHVFTNYADEAWQVSFFRLILIVLLAASVAAGPAVVRWAVGGVWQDHVVPFAVLFSLIGTASTTQLGRPTWRDRRGAAFRLGEVLLLFFAARLLTWAFVEGFPSLAVLRAAFWRPAVFFTGEYVFAALTWLFVWSLSIAFTSDFHELAIQPDEVAARQSHEWGDSRSQWRVARPLGRGELLQHFATRWIGIGILLVVCAGITRLDVTIGDKGILRMGLRGLGLRPEVIASLVCYFLAGLLLMSQGRLAVLRGRWFNQEVEIRSTLMRRWHINSLAFISLIALVALLLPLGSTGWLTGVIEWLIAFVARVMMFIAFVLGLLIALIAALLSSLFGRPLQTARLAPPALVAPPVPSQAEMTMRLPPWLGSAVLWLVVVLVASFLLVNFLRTSGLLESRFGVQLRNWRLWWRARRARVNAVVRMQWQKVGRRLRRVRRRVNQPPAVVTGQQRVLLPRDQVRRYYLTAVKEAGEEGVVRAPHETPLEFAEDLRAEWPDSGDDVEALTEAFLDARYSQQEIGAGDVSRASSAWRRLTRGLRAGTHARRSS